MDTTTLSPKQRTNIWNSLNRTQQQAIMALTQANLKDSVIGQQFNGHSQWRLSKVNIDYNWESRKLGQQADLTCLCGHPLKYQFELRELPKQDKRVLLGYACFADYAGIDRDVTRKLRDNVDAIQMETDYTLYWFIKGRRFPEKSLGKAIDGGALANHPALEHRVQLLRQAGFPLNKMDSTQTRKLVNLWKKHHAATKTTKPTRKQTSHTSQESSRKPSRLTANTFTGALTDLIAALHKHEQVQSHPTILRRLNEFVGDATRLSQLISKQETKQLLALQLLTKRNKQLTADDCNRIAKWTRDVDHRAHPVKKAHPRQTATTSTVSGPNLKILHHAKRKLSGDEAIRYQRYLEMTGH